MLKEKLEELLNSLEGEGGVAFVDCEVGARASPTNPRAIKDLHKELSALGIKVEHISDWGGTNFEECASVYEFSTAEEETHVVFLGNYNEELGTEYLGWQFTEEDPTADNGWRYEFELD